MTKPFTETLVGGILERVKDGKPVASMEHSIDTMTIVKFGVAILGTAILIIIIKKFVFKTT